jgi:hypothetical protein
VEGKPVWATFNFYNCAADLVPLWESEELSRERAAQMSL